MIIYRTWLHEHVTPSEFDVGGVRVNIFIFSLYDHCLYPFSGSDLGDDLQPLPVNQARSIRSDQQPARIINELFMDRQSGQSKAPSLVFLLLSCWYIATYSEVSKLPIWTPWSGFSLHDESSTWKYGLTFWSKKTFEMGRNCEVVTLSSWYMGLVRNNGTIIMVIQQFWLTILD